MPRCSYAFLQIIFGLTPGHLSLWLRFARSLLVEILRDDPLAKVTMPTDDEIREFEAAILAKYTILLHGWTEAAIGKIGRPIDAKHFFNGWTHHHYVSNLFLFSPDGKIRACYINAPGTFHDSTMANMSMIYDRIDNLYDRMGSKSVVDSAFSADRRPSVYKSHQNNVDRNGNMRQRSAVHRQATSVRQLSEWGMRCLQGSFPRLKDRLLYEERVEVSEGLSSR
jgi:hypothetical protein